jgi:hypothetical protein
LVAHRPIAQVSSQLKPRWTLRLSKISAECSGRQEKGAPIMKCNLCGAELIDGNCPNQDCGSNNKLPLTDKEKEDLAEAAAAALKKVCWKCGAEINGNGNCPNGH